MASASGSSASRCSSSSFHHSSRYSTSTVRSSSADSLQPRLHSRFGEETSIRSITDDLEPEQESFARYHGNSRDQSSWDDTFGGNQGDQQSFGGYSEDQKYTGGGFHGNWSLGDTGMQVSGSRRSASTGVVRAMGDSYFLSADVSGFEPQEVVVLAYNQCVVIQAEKSEAAGSVAGRFTQKSVLPEDMDPLSVSSALTSEGILTIRVSRTPKQPGEPGTPVFCSEAHF
ncbi:uncharacterized protein hspb12 [Triplophysa rosa]|uniref:uncharacterized protein hspb12 n=1 Tax=Triplophysa rosa TaxID=992332 RepID=UPI002545F918|nr:uncharacterized protein hspb12 [Triplophysa rosa]